NVVEEPSESITTTSTLTTTTAASTRPKAKGLVIHEEEQATTPTISSQQPSQIKVQDKAEFDEEERLAREKNEANINLTKEWNDIQEKIEADQLLAERLQAREQEELTIEERAKLTKLVEGTKKRKDLEKRARTELEQEVGRIVGIKRLLDAVGVTTALMDINAALSKIKIAERVSTVKERIKTEERIKIA
ncbi:hypothetical protein Tco_1512432, partial [Tanacetum coccineum]